MHAHLSLSLLVVAAVAAQVARSLHIGTGRLWLHRETRRETVTLPAQVVTPHSLSEVTLHRVHTHVKWSNGVAGGPLAAQAASRTRSLGRELLNSHSLDCGRRARRAAAAAHQRRRRQGSEGAVTGRRHTRTRAETV